MVIAPPRRGRPSSSRIMKSGGEIASRRRVQLAAAVCFFLSLLYFGSSCVRSFREGGSSAAVGSPFKGALLRPGAVPPALVSEGRFVDGTGLPPDAADRPHYDLVVAVLVVGGDSQASQDEIARVRRVYSRYSNQVVPDGGSAKPLSLRVVFVVGRAELPENVMLPDTGLLLGDFFHLDVREGYRHLSDKTKALMGLSAHLSFRFLAKTDGDTFPCLSRVTQKLIELPLDEQPRVYAGLLATCGKVFPVGHKLHDPEFLKATGGVLDCHPMYHQGAFYVLGEKIVQHLARSRDLLTVMSVEDAMVGVWLLGIDKVVLDIGGQFYCQCFTHPVPAQKQSFYHFCKTEEKIDGCMTKFGAC